MEPEKLGSGCPANVWRGGGGGGGWRGAGAGSEMKAGRSQEGPNERVRLQDKADTFSVLPSFDDLL